MDEPIRVLICDDQVVVCEGLRAILSTDGGIHVVGVVHDGAAAVEFVSTDAPDVVLMDLKMPVMNGVQATRQIVGRFEGVRVLVLTTFDGDNWVFDAIRAGATGYLLKDTPRDGLLRAIRDVVAGRTPIDSAVAGSLVRQVTQASTAPDPGLKASLSERELEVLQLLAKGLNNAEIAARLYLSEGTVRNYVSAILTKLEVSDRTQAAVLALRYGLA